MIVCLVMMAALVATSGISLTLALARHSAAKRAIESDEANLLAEAGLARGLYELQLGTDFSGDVIGDANGAIGRGTYSATLTPAFAGPGEYTLRSIGTVRGLSRGVSAVVRQASSGVGFFAVNGITMSGGLVDSYNSTAGTYASQVGGGGYANTNGDLASNGNIGLSGSATIWGDATPGPTGLVTGTTSGVQGSTAPAAAPVTLDPYTYAPPIPATGSISSSTTLTSGTYRYTSVTVSAGKVLTFDGDVTLYVDNKFTISGSGYGLLNPGARVTIHQGANDFTISGGGVINQDAAPANLSVFSASTTKVVVSGSAAFFGQIHAPGAAFTVSGGGGYYGSVHAEAMTISGSATMHYDEALGASGSGFEIVVRSTFKP